jgi:hypothetical protein
MLSLLLPYLVAHLPVFTAPALASTAAAVLITVFLAAQDLSLEVNHLQSVTDAYEKEIVQGDEIYMQ